MSRKLEVECWCYGTKRMVHVKGELIGRRQADLLRVTDCEHEDACEKKFTIDCLIGKIREGRWS